MTSALTKGVAYTDPPGPLLAQALEIVNRGIAELPANANGAIVTVATDAGVNGAVVAKVNDHFQVVGFIGKSWGNAITYGGAAKLVW